MSFSQAKHVENPELKLMNNKKTQNHNLKLKISVVNLVKTSLPVGLVVLSLFIGVSFINQSPRINTMLVQADSCPTGCTCSRGCTHVGQCVDNDACVQDYRRADCFITRDGSHPCGSALIGEIEPPKGVDRYNMNAANGTGINIGILVFASKLLKLANIVAGLLIFANFVSAGYTYITSAGNTSLYAEIKDKLTFSIIGIIIIVAAYSGVAIFSYIFFGDPGLLLNPDLTKYGALAP